MRSKHVQRSKVFQMTPSTLRFFCRKGKQKKQMAGFVWTLPRLGVTGCDVGGAWFEATMAKRDGEGMFFAGETGKPLSLAALDQVCINKIGSTVQSPEGLSSYSWRKMGSS